MVQKKFLKQYARNWSGKKQMPQSAATCENNCCKLDKAFKSGLSKFFKGCLSQNLLSPLLNTLSQIMLQKLNKCKANKAARSV